MVKTHLTKGILFTLLLLATATTLFIVHINSENMLAHTYVVLYTVSLMITFVYFFIIITIKLFKIDRDHLKSRIHLFIMYFSIIAIINITISYIIPSITIDMTQVLTTAFGFSFGLIFFDLLLNEK